MARLLINEEEKLEILSKHKNFKKILENELKTLNRGLVAEQTFPTGEVTDPLLKAAEKAGCLTNGKITTFEGKPVYIKRASKDLPERFTTGDTILQYNDYSYYVFPQDRSKRKGPFRWSCPEINKEFEQKAKDAETAKTQAASKSQQEIDSLKNAYIQKYTGSPYNYKSSLTDEEKVSGKFAKVKIKGTSTAEGGPFGETGLIMYKDTTTTTNPEITRVNVQAPDKTQCKKDIEDIFKSYMNGYGVDRNGNPDNSSLSDAQLSTLNDEINRARACTTYYGNWGVLGGGNQLDMYIDVLRGDKPTKIAGREKYITRNSIYNLN